MVLINELLIQDVELKILFLMSGEYMNHSGPANVVVQKSTVTCGWKIHHCHSSFLFSLSSNNTLRLVLQCRVWAPYWCPYLGIMCLSND